MNTGAGKKRALMLGVHRVSPLLIQRLLLSLVCLSLSLAVFVPRVTLTRPVFDVLAVLDITQSMNVLDYRLERVPVSRLMMAKRALSQALQKLPCGSKLGLGVFTEYRTLVLFTPVEVCRHRVELASAVDALSGQMAWANASEIAKGVYGGIQLMKELPDKPSLVFLTDGHEAPPLDAHHRLHFEGPPGEVQGALVGVGGLQPLPVPKIDPEGHPVGYWRADEVLQTDPYSRGRAGSVAREPMVETGPPVAPLPLDQPRGEEQLSALHERYLQLLAQETGLRYRRLVDPGSLLEVLEDRSLARYVAAPADLRWIAGALALWVLIVACVPWPLRVSASVRSPGSSGLRLPTRAPRKDASAVRIDSGSPP